MSILVTYFSAEAGTTAKLAKDLAAGHGADLLEIKPEKPYTNADLNWRNPKARCNREKICKKDVSVAGELKNLSDYDTVYIDIVVQRGTDVEDYIRKASELFPFVDYEEQKRKGHNNIKRKLARFAGESR